MFYSHEHSQLLKRKNKIEILLKTIDYDTEFSLNYQPQISIDGKTLLGVEALLRWHSPELGFVPPSEFIQIAEETGSIIKIGKWVIDTAFNQIKSGTAWVIIHCKLASIYPRCNLTVLIFSRLS